MNRPTPSDAKDDAEVRGWIAEAGDCRVETSPEHIERVRALLLERAAIPPEPAPPPPEDLEGAPLGIGLIRLLALAGLAAAALFAAVYFWTPSPGAWARVAEALQNRKWIHIVEAGEDGLDEESWISPRYQILARKHRRGAELMDAEFEDIDEGFKEEYLVESNTIYRDSKARGRRPRRAQELEIYGQLLNPESLKSSPIPGSEIVSEARREVTENGETWKVCELTLRWTPADSRPDLKMTVRVDPKTELPRTWDIESEAETIRLTFDYPASGPSDLRALGVPATARRDAPLPEETHDQILNGLKVGRNRFDDYCAYVWSESPAPANLRRVWRKGRKWRVEQARPRSTTPDAIRRHDLIPNEIDLAGLKQREPEPIFEPQAVSDGQFVWIYKYQSKPIVPGESNVSERPSVSMQQVYGNGMPDDPILPWADVMPEQIGHPMLGIDRSWEYAIEPKTTDGPSGTVLIRVRHAWLPDSKRPDSYRLWIDPEKNHLALQSEMTVFQPAPPNAISTKVAHIETTILADLARSPDGFWYPARVVRKASNKPGEQVTRFLLDFDAAIPDTLFETAR